ncbi:MAG: PAS domain-containing sensor histidine kinase [Reichenbachiella sp.]|uniref:PAS domain-containing sensor histidine kinase n=1 Tax=Reichenbachiella sp. TaxID=2184521 RepID=UPI0029674B60|nr:PAS domain-containing sensor histidine kinase [Reichenbachiella sp.]MDW3210482.1 PAS domain-containing sensor histidine kinase [Reichenbachiella sp.]
MHQPYEAATIKTFYDLNQFFGRDESLLLKTKGRRLMIDKHTNTFRNIFYSCVEGILLVNKGKITLANPQSHELFGYDENELVGMSIEELMPKEIRKNHVKHRTTYAEKPEPRQMGTGRDLVALKKDGSTFPVEISLNVAEVDNEEVTIAHVIDITKRREAEIELKRSEEQLLIYAAELEQRVLDRTKKLNAAIEELQKSNMDLEMQIKERVKAENEARIALEKEKELNELKTRFVSMASHEFRTPLSAILSSVSLIGKYITDENRDKKLKHINRVKSSVGELTGILNDFLSMDRLDAGKLTVSARELLICDFIHEIADEMRELMKKDQILDLKCKTPDGIFRTDSQILKQVLVNLLSNAIKYSPEGKQVTLDVEIDKKELTIKVVDQGIGIPTEDQKHLFDKFFRANNASHIQGTGLGLNIVKKYLELIDGTIAFESTEGQGSTFVLKLNAIKNE